MFKSQGLALSAVLLASQRNRVLTHSVSFLKAFQTAVEALSLPLPLLEEVPEWQHDRVMRLSIHPRRKSRHFESSKRTGYSFSFFMSTLDS